jgi:flagellar biosynthesis/type III secretory pathway M-ring protein FliF/YscJ
VDPWWWVPIGLAAWFLVSIVAALCIGPFLRRCSQAREPLDQELEELSDNREPPEDEREASLRRHRRRPGLTGFRWGHR